MAALTLVREMDRSGLNLSPKLGWACRSKLLDCDLISPESRVLPIFHPTRVSLSASPTTLLPYLLLLNNVDLDFVVGT